MRVGQVAEDDVGAERCVAENTAMKDPTDLNSPYLALEEQVHPCERAELFAKEIKCQCEMRKNLGWEDYLDLPTGLPISAHFFHALSFTAEVGPPPVPQLFSSTLSSEGGLPSHSLKELTVNIKSDEGDEGSHDEPKEEYVQKINEQWRFDDDAVVMEEE
ncbi:uncharacterized protein EI90DRAFT_3130996 [Cantharellus anzutake]|uniref:uncharacterized protein n=1 Tax=Cantharellus anzutake TaxID=1750568 RepID=UPI0019034642|nr:uncharacterized protein EI90DRAFT_3130996 [Cantharellus anzutake]KAF8322408.1 hypothetical protein EI90DRAFT_3130996 [Cantharellus anzutake]